MQRGMKFEDMKVGTSEFNAETGDSYISIDFKFLSKEDNEVLLEKQLDQMRKIAKKGPDSAQQLAEMIFNTVIYLHPFKDGNGRTARLGYFLLAPDIQKTQESFKDDIMKAVSVRNKEIYKYHHYLNHIALLDVLRNSGFELRQGEPAARYQNKLKSTGFDDMHVAFIAAYKAMTPEERNIYIQEEDNQGRKERVIKESDSMPKELLERIEAQKAGVRRELISRILELGNDPDEPRRERWANYLHNSFKLQERQ